MTTCSSILHDEAYATNVCLNALNVEAIKQT